MIVDISQFDTATGLNQEDAMNGETIDRKSGVLQLQRQTNENTSYRSDYTSRDEKPILTTEVLMPWTAVNKATLKCDSIIKDNELLPAFSNNQPEVRQLMILVIFK